ncbi:hypothetical protein HDK64DRAFT_309832 [Phyllosticta capitalensis]
MRSLGFRRLEGRPTERRRITLLAITICLHVLFWSSLLPFVTMLALFGAHNMDSTVLPSAILTIISAVLSICYLILHSFISRRQHAWTQEETLARRVSIICDVAYRVAASVPIFWFLTTIWNIIIAVRQPFCLLTESAGTNDQEFWRIGSACAAVRSSVAISLIALISSCTLFAIVSKVRRPFEASLFGSCSFGQKRKLPSLEDGTGTVTQEVPPSRHDSEKSLARSIAESTPGPSFPSTPRTTDIDLRSGLGIYTPSARTPPTYGLQHQTAKRSNSTNSLFSVSTVIHYDGASQNGQNFPRHGNYGSPVADSAWRAMHPYPPGSTRSLPFYNLPVNSSRTNLMNSMAPSSSSIPIYESPSEIPSSLRIRTPSGPPPRARPSHSVPSSSSSAQAGSSTSADTEPSFLEAVLAAGHVTPLLTSAGFASQRSSIRAALSGRGSSRRSQKTKTQDQTPVPALPAAIPESSAAPAVTRPRGESIEHLSAAFKTDASTRGSTLQSREEKWRKSSGGRTTSTGDITPNPNNSNKASTTTNATTTDANTEERQSARASASASLRSSLAEWMIKERQSHHLLSQSHSQRESTNLVRLRDASASSKRSVVSSTITETMTATTSSVATADEYAKSDKSSSAGSDNEPLEIFCSGVREASCVGVGLGVDGVDGKL